MEPVSYTHLDVYKRQEYMDFLTLAEKRYSVRKFTRQAINQDTLDQILRAGYLAPTACNRQPQRILIINQEESLEKLRRCTKCHFDAPAALLVCYAKDECWQRSYDGKASGDIDASIVAVSYTHLGYQINTFCLFFT